MKVRYFLWISFAINFILICLVGRGSTRNIKWRKSLCRQHIFHKKCRELAMNRELRKLEPLLEQPRYNKNLA